MSIATALELRWQVREHADAAASWIGEDNSEVEQAVEALRDVGNTLVDRLTAIANLHRGPRTERHGSGCVQCGVIWPCPTVLAINGGDAPRPPQRYEPVPAPLPQCSTRPGSQDGSRG